MILIILSYIGTFAAGTIAGFILTALIMANDPSRGHPL